MTPQFWKLSQGDFPAQDTLSSIERRLVWVHSKTLPKGTSKTSQGEDFMKKAKIGDYFYLTHSNKGIYLLGQFNGPANIFSERRGGWADRPFRLIRLATEVKPYNGPDKWWAPNHDSTFIQVPEKELAMFEKHILIPHFGIVLADFGVDLRRPRAES